MAKTIPFLEFINSQDKPGEFTPVRRYLSNIGFKDDHYPIKQYHIMKDFLADLRDTGYIRLEEPFSNFLISNIDQQVEYPMYDDYDFDVQITARGEQALIDNDRTNAMMEISEKASWPAWFSGAVAIMSFGFSIFQFLQNTGIEDRALRQDSKIISLQSQLSSLSSQIESLSSFHKEKRVLPPKASNQQVEKK